MRNDFELRISSSKRPLSLAKTLSCSSSLMGKPISPSPALSLCAALMIRAGHELGIPVLYHEMGTSQHMPMLTDYYRRLEAVLPLCTEVAALSPRLASEWEVRFPFLPSVSVLPLIMERSKALNLGSPSQADADEIIFGFAARLEEGKGPLVLLDALAKVN